MSSRYLAHFLEDVGEIQKSGSDSGAGVDDASLETIQAATDSGTGVDDASVAMDLVEVADADSGSGTDDAFKEIDATVSESGTGTDDAALQASRQTGDSGTGVDSAFIDSPTPSESGSGSDDARVVKLGTESLAEAEALCGPYAGPVDIRYDGIEITSCVIFEQTGFRSIANGIAGTCLIRVRDLAQQYNFVVGRSLTLTINAQREWTGFVTKVRRGYFFNGTPDSPGETVRYFDLEGVDLNVLFQKRFLYDKASPTTVQLTTYQPDTPDDEIIVQYVADHLDLAGDGISTAGVEHVGTPSEDDEISGAAGWSWGELMRFLRFNTGALDYIDPDGVLHHVDVDTADAPFAVSDTPSGAEEGYRELEVDFDGTQLRNDVMVWGAGQGASQVRFARVTDAASVAEHGTWQIGQFLPTIFRQATVDHIADSYVYGSPQSQRGGKDDVTAVRFVTNRQGLRVAQKVSVNTDTFGFSDVLPIRSIEIAFLTPNDPLWRVAASHALDDPWSTSEFWFPQFNLPGLSIPNLDIPPFDIPRLPVWDPCAPRHEAVLADPSSGDESGTSAWLDMEDQWTTDPVEILAKVKLIGAASRVLGWFNIDEINVIDPNGPRGGAGHEFQALLYINANGNLKIEIYGIANGIEVAPAPVDDLISNISDQWFWMRWRIENTVLRLKVWLDGEVEPAGYQLEGSDPAADFLHGPDGLPQTEFLAFRGINSVIGPPYDLDAEVRLGYLSVIAGIIGAPKTDTFHRIVAPDGWGSAEDFAQVWQVPTNGTQYVASLNDGEDDPCFGVSPPAPDPPRSAAHCEILEAISAPPVQPAGYNYYQFSAGYLNGTTRIFKDGFFLRRGTDYLEILPSLGVIAVDDSITVLFAVYGCYEAQP